MKKYFFVHYKQAYYGQGEMVYKNKLLKWITAKSNVTGRDIRSIKFCIPEGFSEEEVKNYIAFEFENEVTNYVDGVRRNKKFFAEAEQISPMAEQIGWARKLGYIHDEKDLFDVFSAAFPLYMQKHLKELGFKHLPYMDEYGQNVQDEDCLDLVIVNPRCGLVKGSKKLEQFRELAEYVDFTEAMATKEKLAALKAKNEEMTK